MNCNVNRLNRSSPLSLMSELDRVLNAGRHRMSREGVDNHAGSRASAARVGVPLVNVWEDESSVYVESELPGLTMENLDISLTGSELRIRATRSSEQPEAGENAEAGSAGEAVIYHRRERAAGDLQRTLRIGVPIDHDKVTAALAHGVLLITLPKSDAAKPRKIEINAK